MARGRQATLQASGLIEAVARTGKSFKIGEDWFGAFHAKQLNGAQKGDEVEFDYVEVNKGGATFFNIEGDVTIVSEGSGGGNSSRGGSQSRSAPPSRGAAGGRSAPANSSGAVKDDPRQRSIVRQNSLTQANALFATLGRAGLLGETDAEQLSYDVIEAAKLFEKYAMLEDE